MNFFGILVFFLAGGMFIVLHRISIDRIGDRFYRLISILFTVGNVIILLMLQPGSTLEWIQFGLVIALITGGVMHFVILGYDSSNKTQKIIYWLTTTIVTLFIVSFSLMPSLHQTESGYAWYLFFLQFFLSASILGSIFVSMICGHWYLVNTNLSLEPIKSISRTLSFTILVKLFVDGLILLHLFFTASHLFNDLVYTLPLLFWVRFLIGLGGGLLFNWMSWKTLEYNNTQAATGILYACITWIVLGEFSGFYLTIRMGVPL